MNDRETINTLVGYIQDLADLALALTDYVKAAADVGAASPKHASRKAQVIEIQVCTIRDAAWAAATARASDVTYNGPGAPR